MALLQYPTLQAPVLPQGAFAEAVTESRWHQPWSDASFRGVAATFAVVLAASSGQYAEPFPRPNDNPAFFEIWRPLSEPVRTKPRLIDGAQQAAWLTQAAPFNESVTEDRWHQPWSEPVRFKPELKVALQQFSPENPFGITQPETVFESEWHYPWSEPVRIPARLGAGLNPFLFFQLPGGIPEQVIYSKFAFHWSEPVRVAPRLITGANPDDFLIQSSPFTEAVLESKWHYPWSEPVRFKPRLNAALQEFHTMHASPSPFVSAGWFNWLSEPVRVPKRLTTGAQLAFAIQLSPPTAINPHRVLKNEFPRVRSLKDEFVRVRTVKNTSRT